jgi:hypothetical protein
MNEDGSSAIKGLIDESVLNKWQAEQAEVTSRGIKLIGDGSLS